MRRGALTLAAVTLALAGCGSSSKIPRGYVKAPTAKICATIYAQQHHISFAAARNVKCRLVLQFPTSSAADLAAFGPSATASSTSSSQCVLYSAGNDVEAWVSAIGGGADQLCGALVRSLAKGGELWSWRQGDPPRVLSYDHQICQLSWHRDTYDIQVFDDGTAFLGTQLCTGLLAGGWAER